MQCFNDEELQNGPEIKIDIWDNSVWTPEGVPDVSRNVWVREHIIWAEGESPQGFWKAQKEVLRSPGARRQGPWRLALESEKDSCLSGETDFVEAFTPSFDPKAQHINRGVGLAPKRHQETPSRCWKYALEAIIKLLFISLYHDKSLLFMLELYYPKT